MRRARKKKIVIQAYRLGEKSEMIDSLIKKGEICVREDGSFEVFSRETNGDSGEIAQRGDYIKLDSAGRVYPNEAAFFEKNHERPADAGPLMIILQVSAQLKPLAAR